MAAQTYWLADPDGVHAPADGAAARDEMAEAGWLPVDELRPSDQVWTYNEQVRGWSKFGRDILHVWEARGWAPSAPPLVEGDVSPVIDLPAPGTEPAAVPVPDSKPEPKTTEAASPSTSKKENDRA